MLEINVNGMPISVPSWPAQNEKLGAVILVNSGTPTQSSLLTYLAKRLSEQGWFVAMLNNDKNNSVSWIKQLPEIIVTLRQQKYMRIVVLHYGKQLQNTFNYFNKPKAPEIEGLILLSAYNFQSPPNKLKLRLNMPIFDIVGQFDYEWVKQQLAVRRKALANHKKKYLAIEIPGAEQEYLSNRPLLFSFINGWMMKLPELQPKSPTFMYTSL